MGQVFGKDKPLKEIVRENQRMIRKAVYYYYYFFYYYYYYIYLYI